MIKTMADVLRRMEDRMKLSEQIERTKRELSRVKPRSYRRVELETRLKLLMIRQIKHENRQDKRAA